MYDKILVGDYEVPDYVRPVAKDLIVGILNIDQDRRFKIEEIRSHKWYRKMTLNPEYQSIIIGYHQIPVILHFIP